MFAAAIPQPFHQLPGSVLATGIRDALVASSFHSHIHRRPAASNSGLTQKEPTGLLPAHLLPQANALCLILGVESFPVPVKRAVRAPLSIGADALARIRVDDDVLHGEVGAKLAKRLDNRAKRRAKVLAKVLAMAGR